MEEEENHIYKGLKFHAGFLDSIKTCIDSPATMHHHSDQVVKPFGIGGIARGVKEAELQREDHTVA